ncbi:MAG: hypothetical protein ACW99Q_17685, partial [Candidatus Kariarchaeaceae archaeon]|jgi:hypothetical protein
VSNFPNSVLPVPLVLNDDYTMHETVANEAAAAISGEGFTLTVTNDAAEFALDLHGENENATSMIDLTASWRKTDGLLQAIEVDADIAPEGGDPGVTGSMRIVLDKKEHVPLLLDVGDKWKLTVDDVGFDHELSGFSAAEQADVSDVLTQINTQISDINNQVILDLEVKEIDGLYYRVDGMAWDGDTNTMVPFRDIVDTNDGWWFSGFGTLNYQLPKFAVGLAGLTDLYDTGTFVTEPDKQRFASMPGFVITEDWDIYASFDFTISAIVEGYESLLLDALEAQTEVDATVSMDYTGREKDGGYEVTSSVDASASGPLDQNDPTSPTITIEGSLSSTMRYDSSGTLKVLETTGSGGASLTTGETISITNARFKFGIDFDPVNDRPDDDAGGEGPIPGLDVPGFDFYLAIMSILSLGFVLRRKRY